VSEEKTYYADLTDSPEIQAVTRAQVGRLSSRCRVFAPIYRQVTAYGLTHPSLAPAGEPDFPMLDVQAAWNYYLENDNEGRGVVLIGHSVKAGQFGDADTAILKTDDIGGGWGLHPQDIALVQGNILLPRFNPSGRTAA
jgi:hypothetical protein